MVFKQRRRCWTGRVTRCKRVVRTSLAGETQAYVETLDMLEFTKVFYALFLDPWKSLSDVESFFEKQHKSPVITDAKSLYDALERSESSTRNLTERRTAIEADGLTKPQAAWKLLEIYVCKKMENRLGRDFPECKKAQGGRTVRRQKRF